MPRRLVEDLVRHLEVVFPADGLRMSEPDRDRVLRERHRPLGFAVLPENLEASPKGLEAGSLQDHLHLPPEVIPREPHALLPMFSHVESILWELRQARDDRDKQIDLP